MPGPHPSVSREGGPDVVIQNVHSVADGPADLARLPFRVAGKLADGQREEQKNDGGRQKHSCQTTLYAKPFDLHS